VTNNSQPSLSPAVVIVPLPAHSDIISLRQGMCIRTCVHNNYRVNVYKIKSYCK